MGCQPLCQPLVCQNIDGADGYMWDTNLLYGASATWDLALTPLLGSGATIIDTGAQLRDKLDALLQGGAMDEAGLAELAVLIAERLCGQHERVCVALIRQLAAGKPVSSAQLAETLTMEERAVGPVLRKLSDVDFDGAGNVVGFGLSLIPTVHHFIINGQTLYTWCALDTFMYTALLNQQSQVISRCPVTARPIALAMTPAGVSELTPASSVISVVMPKGSIMDCRRSAFCDHGHFFATAAAGEFWQHDHPDSVVLPVGMAHRLGRLLADRRLRLADD